MLTKKELRLPTPELAQLLHERLAGIRVDDENVPQSLRDFAVLFELDAEVRNGGFAQYFFNHSCHNAFDAWFASDTLVPEAHSLLSAALRRLGAEFGVNLDLQGLLDSSGVEELGPAYGALLQTYARQHQSGGEPFERLANFRNRLAAARGELEGFDTLNKRFYEETSIPSSIVELVKESPDEYVS